MAASAAQESDADAALLADLAKLQAFVDDKAAALAVADDTIAALTDEVALLASVEDELIAVEDEVEALKASIAVRDLAITELRAQPQVPSASALIACQEQSNAVLDGAGITFQPGTAALAPSAIAQLESIAAIATDCTQNDLVLEIEGHTDSEGGNASNLLLSNGRAKAVYDFLSDRGVPASSMRPVGFGKADPVADNATADGRAKNERIVFDWEQS